MIRRNLGQPRASNKLEILWSTNRVRQDVKGIFVNPTVSNKAKALRSLGKPIISSEARGQRDLYQPAASTEARG